MVSYSVESNVTEVSEAYAGDNMRLRILMPGKYGYGRGTVIKN